MPCSSRADPLAAAPVSRDVPSPAGPEQPYCSSFDVSMISRSTCLGGSSTCGLPRNGAAFGRRLVGQPGPGGFPPDGTALGLSAAVGLGLRLFRHRLVRGRLVAFALQGPRNGSHTLRVHLAVGLSLTPL